MQVFAYRCCLHKGWELFPLGPSPEPFSFSERNRFDSNILNLDVYISMFCQKSVHNLVVQNSAIAMGWSGNRRVLPESESTTSPTPLSSPQSSCSLFDNVSTTPWRLDTAWQTEVLRTAIIVQST